MRAIFVFIFVATFTAPIYGGYQLLGLSQPFGASSAKGLNTAEFAGSADEYWPDDCEPRRSSQWRWPSPESNVGFRYFLGLWLAGVTVAIFVCSRAGGYLPDRACRPSLPKICGKTGSNEVRPECWMAVIQFPSGGKKAGMPLVREIAETGWLVEVVLQEPNQQPDSRFFAVGLRNAVAA